MESTFLMIKPDGVQRGLVATDWTQVSDVIARFERKGFTLRGMKMMNVTEDLADKHYAEHVGKGFYPGLKSFITSGPVVAMVWSGKDVIATCRTMMGATNPSKAAPGTIRGDYACDMGRNIIHGSDGLESAAREIALWFGEDVIEWTPENKKWIYE